MAITLPAAVPRRQLYFDGAVLAAATAGMLATLVGWGDNPVRVGVGLVLALFSPGYALLKALFPTGSSAAERFGLSIPASIVLAVLAGALVNDTPFGLSAPLIVLLLWISTVVLLAIAYTRVLRWHATRTPVVSRNGTVHAGRVGLPGALVTAAVLLAAGAWTTSSLIAASRTAPKPFTALAVNGANGVPTPGEPLTVTLDNQEGQPMQYDLEVRTDGNVQSRIEGVQLAAGGQYSMPLPLVTDQGSGTDVVVFRSGDSEPYRLVHVGGSAAWRQD